MFSCLEFPSLFHNNVPLPASVKGLEWIDVDVPYIRIQIPYFNLAYHYDCYENLLVQIQSQKKVRFFEKSAITNPVGQSAFEFVDIHYLFNETDWQEKVYEY